MDAELKAALEAMEMRITARFELVDKRFEQIDEQFEQIHKRFEQIDKRLEKVDKRFEEVFERINDTETKLLNAFYGWAKPVESRLKIIAIHRSTARFYGRTYHCGRA